MNKVTTIRIQNELEKWLKEWRIFLKISIVVLRKVLICRRCQLCPPEIWTETMPISTRSV